MAACVWILLLCCLLPWVHTRKLCVTPPSIANGQLRYAGPYYVPDEAVYDCDPGFTASGTAAARCVGYNGTHGHFTANGFPPLCVSPLPVENTSVVNNYLEGMPEWLSILLGVIITLVVLLLLTCAGVAIWYMCCRYKGGIPGGGASNGWGSSRVSSQNHTNTMYKTSTNSTNEMTNPTHTSVRKQDAGTQVQLRESGNYGTNAYQQKPNTTITKVYMEETRGTTSGTKPLPPLMPHSQPPRTDVYHSKSTTK